MTFRLEREYLPIMHALDVGPHARPKRRWHPTCPSIHREAHHIVGNCGLVFSSKPLFVAILEMSFQLSQNGSGLRNS